MIKDGKLNEYALEVDRSALIKENTWHLFAMKVTDNYMAVFIDSEDEGIDI